MKKILSVILLIVSLPVYSTPLEGGVAERNYLNQSRIIDKKTGKGISGAEVSIPKERYKTKTNQEGFFELDTSIDGTTIMSVKKDKYKPFTMTINEKSFDKPIVVGIEKSNSDISIDTNMHHLGDGSFSDLSANSSQLFNEASGPFFTKNFSLKGIDFSKPVYLVIGSIIGIDTLTARSMGQNKNPNSYASPPEVYFNGNKIAEIQINGDNQKIRIPQNLLIKNHKNEVTIKTGRNLMQTSHIDYDDIEFMNLLIEN